MYTGYQDSNFLNTSFFRCSQWSNKETYIFRIFAKQAFLLDHQLRTASRNKCLNCFKPQCTCQLQMKLILQLQSCKSLSTQISIAISVASFNGTTIFAFSSDDPIQRETLISTSVNLITHSKRKVTRVHARLASFDTLILYGLTTRTRSPRCVTTSSLFLTITRRKETRVPASSIQGSSARFGAVSKHQTL